MTADNPIADILASPFRSGWTIEGLAEQVLGAIAASNSGGNQEFILDADTTADRQTRRVLRPFLACLATMSATEAGIPPNLYGGQLAFTRPGPSGLVWITGEFDNRPGSTRIVLRRSGPVRTGSPVDTSEPAEGTLDAAKT